MKQIAAPVVGKGVQLPPLLRRGIAFSQTITIHCPEIAMKSKPGQFVMVRCGESVLPRPFSIHQVNAQGDLMLYFAVFEKGKGTQWLSQRSIGDKVEIFGPLGNGFLEPVSHSLLLIAGGMGIAPLYFLAQEASMKKLSTTLVYGTAVKNPYPEDTSDIKLIRATDDGSVGHSGLVTDLIPEHAKQADQIFVCGPLPMYRAMAKMPELKNKLVQVSLEVVMGCGRGVCYGCTIKTKAGLKKVCEDGPVFKLADILWDEMNSI